MHYRNLLLGLAAWFVVYCVVALGFSVVINAEPGPLRTVGVIACLAASYAVLLVGIQHTARQLRHCL